MFVPSLPSVKSPHYMILPVKVLPTVKLKKQQIPSQLVLLNFFLAYVTEKDCGMGSTGCNYQQ